MSNHKKPVEVFKVVTQNFGSIKMECEGLAVQYGLNKYATAPVGMFCCFKTAMAALMWGLDFCETVDFLILRCKTTEIVEPDNITLPYFNRAEVDLNLIKAFWKQKNKDEWLETAVRAGRCNVALLSPDTVYCRTIKPVEVYSNPATLPVTHEAPLPDVFDGVDLDFSQIVPLTPEQIRGVA